jgi:hypothetical protein
MLILERIAEKRISEAMERGEFENLSGSGRPLVQDDNPMVPESLRMAFKILKNAGITPPEVEARTEIRQLEDMLSGMEDEAERLRAMKRLNVLRLKIDTGRPDRQTLCVDALQHQRVVERLARKPRP